jgi:hypothetical protein
MRFKETFGDAYWDRVDGLKIDKTAGGGADHAQGRLVGGQVQALRSYARRSSGALCVLLYANNGLI